MTVEEKVIKAILSQIQLNKDIKVRLNLLEILKAFLTGILRINYADFLNDKVLIEISFSHYKYFQYTGVDLCLKIFVQLNINLLSISDVNNKSYNVDLTKDNVDLAKDNVTF